MKKMVVTPRELEIIKYALQTDASRNRFPANEITALLKKLEKEPPRYFHLDWFGESQEL